MKSRDRVGGEIELGEVSVKLEIEPHRRQPKSRLSLGLIYLALLGLIQLQSACFPSLLREQVCNGGKDFCSEELGRRRRERGALLCLRCLRFTAERF